MKIGMFTFHRANNLGAVLQASALQKYVQNNFGDCEIVDYYPNSNIPVTYKGIKKILRKCKRIAIYPLTKKKRKREYRFDEYRKKYFKMTEQHFYGDNCIKDELKDFDILISGSDQILNTTLTGNSRAYYLDFFEGKKISYASSFGRTNITQNEIDLIKSELPHYSAVSVREKSAGEIIKRISGIDSELVMDHVFLLKKEEWESRCNMDIILPERFIFVYSMENSENLERVVHLIKEEKNIPVIVVRGGGKAGRIVGKEDSTCGPAEFLRYIKNAEYVVTNSFHGIAFSIIMNRRFYAIAHSKRNARIENILNLINKESKLISHRVDESINDYMIDSEKVQDKIERYIINSKKYLEMAIDKGEK